MQEFTNKYVIGFAVAICVGCSLLIAGTALSLKEIQDRNAEVDMKLNVLRAAGVVEPGKSLSQEDVLTSFTEQITAKVVDISTGEILEGEEVAEADDSFDLGERCEVRCRAGRDEAGRRVLKCCDVGLERRHAD